MIENPDPRISTDILTSLIEQDDFGTLAMKGESAVGPFYRKLVLLRYFPKFGTFSVPSSRSGKWTLGPEIGPLVREPDFRESPENRTFCDD